MSNLTPTDWDTFIAEERQKPYFAALRTFVEKEYATHVCYPERNNIYNAFRLCPFDRLKVVLLGQDPYHEPGQAQGLCFSVAEGVKLPPSLRNIYKELSSDLHAEAPKSGDLSPWAEQGVFLLNASLTVREHQANSHAKHGWETFTDAAIRYVNKEKQYVVFLLWGNYAQQKMPLIDGARHLILRTAHPSPLSAYHGFFGCRHFSMTNEYLRTNGLEPIHWI